MSLSQLTDLRNHSLSELSGDTSFSLASYAVFKEDI